MSGRGKGGNGLGANKKVKVPAVAEYEFKHGDSVVLVNYCEGDDNPIVSGFVPQSCIEKHLSIWLNNCNKAQAPETDKAFTCNVNLADRDDNEQFQEYVKEKDLRDDGDVNSEDREEDDDIKDDDDDDDDDEVDDEVEDMYDLLAGIETWAATFLPEWDKNTPPPSKAIKVVARFNINGSTE